MKIEISKVRRIIGTKYTASVIPEKGPPLLREFGSWRDLLVFVREMKNRARAAGQLFEVVRKTN